MQHFLLAKRQPLTPRPSCVLGGHDISEVQWLFGFNLDDFERGAKKIMLHAFGIPLGRSFR